MSTSSSSRKRIRPTWGMVNDLRSRLDSQIEGTSRLVSDCDGWREKYQSLLREKSVLEGSNRLMESELSLQHEMNDELYRKNEELRLALRLLKTRGFWSRLFNRDY